MEEEVYISRYQHFQNALPYELRMILRNLIFLTGVTKVEQRERLDRFKDDGESW
jgi:hypothetical protein